MICADFKNSLLPQDNGKANHDVSKTNKYQSHIPCSWCYKLLPFDDQFSLYFKIYLGKSVLNKFVIYEDKEYCELNIVIKFLKNILIKK